MKKQINIPELLPEHLGGREQVRQNTQRGEEIVKIELDKILVRKGFNVRVDYGDLKGLAVSILENGQTQAGRVDVLEDGTFLLVDGHRRFEAMKLLKSRGHEPLFKAVVNNSKTTEEQRILQMFTSQDNKQLEPHESAELIRRLINLGHPVSGVATKIGKSVTYVNSMLEYANESPEIKQHVEKGNMTVSAVLKVQKNIPATSARVQAINTAVENSGGKKVVAEDILNSKDEKAEKIAKAVAKLLESVDPEFVEKLKVTIKKHL